MFEEAVEVWARSGAGAAVDFLNGQEDQLVTAETYHKLMKHLYWQESNVPDMVIVGQAGIDYALAAANAGDDSDPEMAYNLRSWAKSMAYDLASFTWRGWDEPGMVLTAADEALGLQAAQLNLQLAADLDKGPLRISRAHWVLGAQQLSAGQLAQAQDSFRAGARFAASAGVEGDERNCQAFAALVASMQQPEDTGLQGKLDEAMDDLLDVEYGRDYVEQIKTAARVFG